MPTLLFRVRVQGRVRVRVRETLSHLERDQSMPYTPGSRVRVQVGARVSVRVRVPARVRARVRVVDGLWVGI